MLVYRAPPVPPGGVFLVVGGLLVPGGGGSYEHAAEAACRVDQGGGGAIDKRKRCHGEGQKVFLHSYRGLLERFGRLVLLSGGTGSEL